jgi:hypothetical protein
MEKYAGIVGINLIQVHLLISNQAPLAQSQVPL